MGCLWSNEDSQAAAQDRYQYQRRVINTGGASRQPAVTATRVKPLFGEYRCTCGRYWTSRLSWPHGYQVCKRCRKNVYAATQRELRPSDITHNKDVKEHQKEYCQMCQQLGQYCGNISRNRRK